MDKKRRYKKAHLIPKNTYSSAVHFGPLTVQPLDRCLNRNKKYEYCREYIQVKWFSMYDDIVSIMAKKYEKLIKLGD